MDKDAQKLRRSTTDNISLAPQFHSKQNWTDREEKRINNSGSRTGSCKNIFWKHKENRAATAAGRNQRVEKMQTQKQKPTQSEKDPEQGEVLGGDDVDMKEAGSEESLKDRELNLGRQACEKVDEHGKPTDSSEAKCSRKGSRHNERASGQEKKDEQTYRGDQRTYTCSSNLGTQRTKREKQINFSKASWNLASCKIKDASDFLVHPQLEIPRGIICLEEFPQNIQTGLWRKLCSFERSQDAGSVACTKLRYCKGHWNNGKGQLVENPGGQPSKSSSTVRQRSSYQHIYTGRVGHDFCESFRSTKY